MLKHFCRYSFLTWLASLAAPRYARRSIEIVHFNDVYDIEGRSQSPQGGAARFVSKVKEIYEEVESASGTQPLVLFSGDAFNPSLMSTITKGKQMVPVLNSSKIDVACMGNHDFDFGIENLISLTRNCEFPWLISNVVYKPTGRPLAEGKTSFVKVIGGRRIGFVGLVEKEWMATLSTIDEEDIIYEDFVSCAKRLSKVLRDHDECDAVIALTHMRVPNDAKLAEEAGECIDLICAGHDHHYDVKPVGKHGIYVLKSGTDFRDMTRVKMEFGDNGSVKVAGTERVVIDESVPEDEEIKEVVSQYLGVLGAEMEKKIGHTNVELEGRFSKVRTQETNLGNFVTDIMRRGTSSDIALLNSGTLRADSIIPAGDLLMKDMVAILPMVDELCVLEMSGDQLIEALENGVSQYPRLEGRFPQISGVSFVYDAALEPMSRVVRSSVQVHGSPITSSQLFSVCVKAYIAKGKDGYDVFAKCKVLIDEENAPVLPALVRNTFTELSVLNGFKHTPSKMRKGSVLKSAKKWRSKTFHATPVKGRGGSGGGGEGGGEERKVDSPGPLPAPASPEGGGGVGKTGGGLSFGISPQMESRIVCLNPASIDF
ncbi:hypothetical protein TL16_g06902 [Triparma laevis f. inornata]|uniref:5'-nucleotidase n=1 Tax=Triparma laevis f. inornata TaxID=1714386 RepID=A0A9W7EC31_9STRA|nr:hypothetical protein TL16_g06902 [Triparma laevis f. inornata]